MSIKFGNKIQDKKEYKFTCVASYLRAENISNSSLHPTQIIMICNKCLWIKDESKKVF